MSKMEKKLTDAKKIYEEKLKKNEIYKTENEVFILIN
jgi:hypothetical protein